MSIHKKDVIRHLEKIALYMELQGNNPFRISAFRKAAAALESDERSLAEIDEFTAIPNIGKGTATVINQFQKTATSDLYEQLKAEVPEGLIDLLKIPGLGGKKIATLHQQLNINNLADLKLACEQNKVQTVRGFGVKTEQNILAAFEKISESSGRLPLAKVLPVALNIEKYLQQLTTIEQFSRAGSLRRVAETVKDLDFIISTEQPELVKEQLLNLPNISETIAAGQTKISVQLSDEVDVAVDFRLVRPDQFATALHHFTGSKDHNVKMRQIAKERNEKINEYGVVNNTDGKITTFQSEAAFFHHFNLPFIPPEMREDGTELEVINEQTEFLNLGDMKGDLHMHTTWSDGAHSIEEMVIAARERNYEYIAITDHSQYLQVANGLTIERLQQQRLEIERLNDKYDDIEILAGVEMDILPDGTLDFEDEFLKQFDFVIAAIHSSFSQSEAQIMNRLEAALNNRYVDMVAHPTGRIIGRRDGYNVNMERLIKLAKETKTILELNANPYRFDLGVENLRAAITAGVKIAINTDAHQIDTLNHMQLGIAVANKALVSKGDLINTLSISELKEFLQERRKNPL